MKKSKIIKILREVILLQNDEIKKLKDEVKAKEMTIKFLNVSRDALLKEL
jgi:hypothetical protein